VKIKLSKVGSNPIVPGPTKNTTLKADGSQTTNTTKEHEPTRK